MAIDELTRLAHESLKLAELQPIDVIDMYEGHPTARGKRVLPTRTDAWQKLAGSMIRRMEVATSVVWLAQQWDPEHNTEQRAFAGHAIGLGDETLTLFLQEGQRVIAFLGTAVVVSRLYAEAGYDRREL